MFWNKCFILKVADLSFLNVIWKLNLLRSLKFLLFAAVENLEQFDVHKTINIWKWGHVEVTATYVCSPATTRMGFNCQTRDHYTLYNCLKTCLLLFWTYSNFPHFLLRLYKRYKKRSRSWVSSNQQPLALQPDTLPLS